MYVSHAPRSAGSSSVSAASSVRMRRVVRAVERLAQGHDDVARLERAGGGTGEQRGVEHEVDVADERDAGALRRQDPFEGARGVEAAEAASGDDDVPGHASEPTALAP